MSKKLYVGNLSWSTSKEELAEFFSKYGAIEEAIIVTDNATGRSRGFGFVTFENDADADAAVEATNGQEFKERQLTVNEARPLRPRD